MAQKFALLNELCRLARIELPYSMEGRRRRCDDRSRNAGGMMEAMAETRASRSSEGSSSTLQLYLIR